ncbi:MAG: 16S rRNA (cytosine(1402)-N(4))-methyltransferase RsmH [Patescibacteria group bacterium]
MHKPVLLQESVEGLDLKPSEIFVDGTYGGGGHTKEVRRKFPEAKIITIDQDPSVGADITGNFRKIDELLGETRPDAILLDIGLSSNQLEESGRGFSFQKDEPLDMRMSQSGVSAADILNSWDEHAIELILRGFGEERYSRQIAGEIVRRREVKPFVTTTDLVEVVSAVKPKSWKDKIHPATKTFQALRIAVNEELTALEEGLAKAFEVLNTGGRLAVISFHSLEDRIVKNFFRNLAQEGKVELINKKPIEAGEEEIKENPRSRSAKLRIIKKL